MMSVCKPSFNIYLFITLFYFCGSSNAIIDVIPSDNVTEWEKILNLLFSQMDLPKLDKVISDIIADGGIEKYNAGLKNEDKDLNITQLIEKYSFRPEVHHVRTSDGYKLKMHRIPRTGKLVLMWHGLFCSSDDWVTAGPGDALPYLLAERGYDVWLGNSRGNKYSREHEWLSPESKEYWDFSWQESGLYDLPACIDYMLKVTGQQQIKFVGHSMGATAFFVMTSEKPEYNDKVSIMAALSAVAWMSHTKSPVFRFLVYVKDLLNYTFTALGTYEFFPNRGVTKILTRYICGSSEFASFICLMFLLAGFDYGQLNMPQLPVVFAHAIAGSSKNQILGIVQAIESRRFCGFDYGKIKNMEVYGSSKPLDHPVEKITTKVAIAWGHNDWIADVEDVKMFATKLKSLVDLYEVPEKQFCHSDFLWAKDVKKLVYTWILQLFDKY